MLFKKLAPFLLPSVVFAQGNPDLSTVLGGNANLSVLAGLVKAQPQLLQALGSAQNITILAPNNDALSTLLNTTAGKSLAADSGAVAALLSYHVLNGTYYSSQITNTSAFIPTLLNNATYANVTGGQRVQALLAQGNVTLISGLLQNSTVVQANQNFTGGTIHIINSVLQIPTNLSTALVSAKLSAAFGALNATGLLDAANGLKDVTIFAPNNSGFANIASVLKNASTDTLKDILEYHVVNGSTPLYSTGLSNTTVKSLQGTDLTIELLNGSVFVNNAKVVTPDILVAGGVVHIIDEVLNPKNATAKPAGSTGAVAFSGAASSSDIPFTSGVPGPSVTVGGGAPAATSKTSKAGAVPMITAAPMGAAALIGAGVMLIL